MAGEREKEKGKRGKRSTKITITPNSFSLSSFPFSLLLSLSPLF